MPNITTEFLQKHRESIAEETCNEIFHKIPQYRNQSFNRVSKTFNQVIELVYEHLVRGNGLSLESFVKEFSETRDPVNSTLSLDIEGINIFRNIVIKKLVAENHNDSALVISTVQKINRFHDQFILLLSDHYEKQQGKILENRETAFSRQIKNTTAGLEKIKQFNEDILESMTSGLIVVDNESFTIQKYNKAMKAITGIPAEAALGKSLEEAFNYIEGVPFEYFYREITTKGKIERTKLKLKRKSGEEVYRFIRADALHDKSGKGIGIMLIIDDVTENEIVKESFSRYVAHQVVERILKGKEKVCLSGVRKEVSVLFADVRGFTTLSENCEPEQVVSMLNNFFGLMVDTVFDFEGTLDKFIGDNIMAVFGAPVSCADDAERAVLAALEMQQKIKKYNKGRLKSNEKPLKVGIGINTGNVVAGNIGSEKRMDYTVIGDTVNFADRVQSQSRGGEILISESTFAKVEGKIVAKKLMPRFVKGKQKEVVLYKVMGKR